MKLLRCALVALGTVAASSAMAGAQLTKIDGRVLVNKGTGYSQAAPASSLKVGDRIMVNPGSKATLRFADGCTIPVKPGSVVTIGTTSPCSFKAQNNENGNNPYLPFIVGGGAAVLAGLGIWALTNNDDGFVSVP